MADDIGRTPSEHIAGGWEQGCRCLACSIGHRNILHGSLWAYLRGCRCAECRQGNRDRHYLFTVEHAAKVAANPRKYKHGLSRYTNARCRCKTCVTAKNAYNRRYRATHPQTLPAIGIGEIYVERAQPWRQVAIEAVVVHPRVRTGRTIYTYGGRENLPAWKFLKKYRPATAADCRPD